MLSSPWRSPADRSPRSTIYMRALDDNMPGCSRRTGGIMSEKNIASWEDFEREIGGILREYEERAWSFLASDSPRRCFVAKGRHAGS